MLAQHYTSIRILNVLAFGSGSVTLQPPTTCDALSITNPNGAIALDITLTNDPLPPISRPIFTIPPGASLFLPGLQHSDDITITVSGFANIQAIALKL